MTFRNTFPIRLLVFLVVLELAPDISAGTKCLPVLNKPIRDFSSISAIPVSLDLNLAFGTEAIDDQVVRFTSHFNSNGSPVVMDFALFSHRAPNTRTNFLKYVTDGDYINSFIHR